MLQDEIDKRKHKKRGWIMFTKLLVTNKNFFTQRLKIDI